MTNERFVLTPTNLKIIGEELEAQTPYPAIAKRLGITEYRLRNVLNTIGVLRDKRGTGGRRSMQKRFSAPQNRGALVLDDDHPSVVEGRTLFRNGDLRNPAETERPVILPGSYNPKLGSKVRHGRWAGFPIYHLSLEERATCPRECETWASCYGNGMHRAARHLAGPALKDAIKRDLYILNGKHPNGFVVRLHTLGDFYSKEYALLWSWALERYPSVNAFGYTRRHPGMPDGIGDVIASIRKDHWDRFAIRFSGKTGERNAFVLKGRTNSSSLGDAFVCKQEWAEQQGDLSSLYCGNCTACWESDRPVVFVEH